MPSILPSETRLAIYSLLPASALQKKIRALSKSDAELAHAVAADRAHTSFAAQLACTDTFVTSDMTIVRVFRPRNAAQEPVTGRLAELIAAHAGMVVSRHGRFLFGQHWVMEYAIASESITASPSSVATIRVGETWMLRALIVADEFLDGAPVPDSLAALFERLAETCVRVEQSICDMLDLWVFQKPQFPAQRHELARVLRRQKWGIYHVPAFFARVADTWYGGVHRQQLVQMSDGKPLSFVSSPFLAARVLACVFDQFLENEILPYYATNKPAATMPEISMEDLPTSPTNHAHHMQESLNSDDKDFSTLDEKFTELLHVQLGRCKQLVDTHIRLAEKLHGQSTRPVELSVVVNALKEDYIQRLLLCPLGCALVEKVGETHGRGIDGLVEGMVILTEELELGIAQM